MSYFTVIVLYAYLALCTNGLFYLIYLFIYSFYLIADDADKYAADKSKPRLYFTYIPKVHKLGE